MENFIFCSVPFRLNDNDDGENWQCRQVRSTDVLSFEVRLSDVQEVCQLFCLIDNGDDKKGNDGVDMIVRQMPYHLMRDSLHILYKYCCFWLESNNNPKS